MMARKLMGAIKSIIAIKNFKAKKPTSISEIKP
jgi:hypothetical protein